MDKPFIFESLFDLINNYRSAYNECYHVLLKVYFGLPFPHDCFSDTPIKWRAISINLLGSGDKNVAQEIETYLESMELLRNSFEASVGLRKHVSDRR
jgi:hypothetical protein